MSALERDRSCFQDLHWRLDLGALVDWDGVEARLRPDLVADSSPAFLRVFQAQDGHQIVIVPRTGRVQIRIDPLVALDEREPAARVLAQRLLEAVGGVAA